VPPSSREIAGHFGVTQSEALQALRDMKIGKAILVHPQTGEIWMAGPFASLPTQYRVVGRTTEWWANCAWDMLGVASLVKEPVRIETRCTDCGDPMTFQVDPSRDAISDTSVVHFLVPARHWYDDIGFT
jgi:hypothetical protein